MKYFFFLITLFAISVNFSQIKTDSNLFILDSVNLKKLNEIIISSSRIPESVMNASTSVIRLNTTNLKNASAATFYEAIESSKGMHVITPSLAFKVLNSRGFANTTNVRFSQLIDGIDNQAPHIGAPIANAMGANELDIVRIEIIPGSASVLYGINAVNGLANIITKNPFTYPGIAFQQVSGINHLNSKNGNSPQFYSLSNLRIAKLINPKLAFKANFSYTAAQDWYATNNTDLAANLNASSNLTGVNNPAYDAVSSYGNESPNRKTINLDGKQYVVSRTGYYESDFSDYAIKNFKGDFALYFRPKINHEISVTYRFADINNIYQRSNRFKLQDYILQQLAISYHSPILQFHSFLSNENTGKSYNLRSLAENMDRAFKSDEQWFKDYSTSFEKAIDQGESISSAHQFARKNSDEGRFIPGSKSFKEKKEELIKINNWDYGAALRVKSNLLHFEGLISWDKLYLNFFKKLNTQLLSGFDFQNYFIVPDGNYFINPTMGSKNLMYRKGGLFTQISKEFFKEKLKCSATIRADKSDYFKAKFTPRINLQYKLEKNLTIRVSYQNAYRFPSIFEGFSNVNSGGVKRVGGLKIMSDGIFENSYTKASIEAFQSKVNSDINTLNLSQNQSIDKNKEILQKNTYSYLKPEFVKSFEFGVRALTIKKKLFIDADFYYTIYKNFIAQVEASVPKTNELDSIPTYLFSKSLQNRYRLWTNSKSTVYNYGTSVALNYQWNKTLSLIANLTMSKLDRVDNKDGLEDGYNTPLINLNVTVIAEQFWKNMSTSFTYRYQSEYDYLSFLVHGNVPAFYTIDAQINYHFYKPNLLVKIGSNNLLNHYYYNILDGPAIGGFYYLSLTLQLN